MPLYCLDTSGLSNPAEHMPQDIHTSLWAQIEKRIVTGVFATTPEVYEELTHISPPIGKCIEQNKGKLVYEIRKGQWDWEFYIEHTNRMQAKYKPFISERNNNRARMISLNDLSVIALGKTLDLPVISMEKRKAMNSTVRKGIPDICDAEEIKHMDFNELLKAENIKL